MHTYSYPIFTQNDANEESSLVWALCISIMLHICIAYIYPYLKQHAVMPQQTSIEMHINMLSPPSAPLLKQPEAELAPIQPPTPVEKTPIKVPEKQPVLSTQSPIADESYQVPVSTEQKVEVAPQPVEAIMSSQSTHTSTANIPTEETNTQTNIDHAPIAIEKSHESSTSEIASADEAWDGYGKALAAMVNKMKQYPTIAVRRHQEGEVQVVASFKRGKLVSVELAQVSNYEALNAESLRTIKKAIEQVALNTSLEKKTFAVTIPVIFALE
jgi:periplasmic protein TonB